MTEKDLLNPQVGDFIAEDTIHGKVIWKVARLLEQHYAEQPDVAVWTDLKIAFEIPGLTTGPGPDIFVVEGVKDRDRWRSCFRYRKEPGEIRLVIEVVSKGSLKKDFKSIFQVYNRMEIEEYLVIHPVGWYPDGPFELHGWRRDPRKKKLCPFAADAQGRLHSRSTGILLGTAAEGYGLQVWNAQTGKLLRTAAEEWAEQEKERTEQEKKAKEELALENERLRAELEELRHTGHS